jgi:hypothetical protein
MARARAFAADSCECGSGSSRRAGAYRIERIERGQRVLEDRADLRAANPAHLLVGQIVDPPPFQADLAAGYPARRLQQADDSASGQRFAGA